MKTDNFVVTGSSGLIGSAVVRYFCDRGWRAHGMDNPVRAGFFGPHEDTRRNHQHLQRAHPDFTHQQKSLSDIFLEIYEAAMSMQAA